MSPSGEWNDDDYDVLADGVVVGRIMKAAASPKRFWASAAFADPIRFRARLTGPATAGAGIAAGDVLVRADLVTRARLKLGTVRPLFLGRDRNQT